LVEDADPFEVVSQGRSDLVRENCHAVFAALAFTNRDPALIEIDVFDT